MANTYVWVLWMTAAMLIATLTYNPLYHLTLLATLLITYRLMKANPWNPIKIGVILSIPLLAINILFLHTGEHVLLEIPPKIRVLDHTLPILLISGPITLESLGNALIFMLLMINTLLVFTAFNMKTTPDSLIRIMPPRLSNSALLAGIALKFVPTLTQDVKSISDAQKSRGLNLEKGGAIQKIKNNTSLIIPTIVNSLEKSYSLAEAMESRGYSKNRTKYSDEQWTKKDVILASTMLFIIASTICLKLLGHLEYWNALTVLEGTQNTNPLMIALIGLLTLPPTERP